MLRDARELALRIPKAELHIHVEGTLEPEMMLALAERNGVALPFESVEDARRAYQFEDLQSFLNIYYQGASVLRSEEDFFELTWAYLGHAQAQGVRHVELFFDPQTHTDRGIALEAVLQGIREALRRGEQQLEISYGLIPCILRHRSAEAAMACLETLLTYRDDFLAVGLDSSEVGHPPGKFVEVFARAAAAGLPAVAHAGEEGPPAYISEALDLLHARRIDHGVRCLEDPNLVRRLREQGVPLTVCPLSNVALRVFERLQDHNLPALLAAGLRVTLNSDDPAYFGGYVGDTYVACVDALGLTHEQIIDLARASFECSLSSDGRRKAGWVPEYVDAMARADDPSA